jgi:Kef-type K+ transport system membrane component KefB
MREVINYPFYEFAIILIFSTLAGAIGRILRQPLIVSFIAVGIFLGPAGINLVHSTEQIELLAEIGISILLFVVGLKLDINLVKSTGKVSLLTGLGQVVFTSAFGCIIALLLGFTPVHSIYIAIALTFSSTIIIVKMLSDKKEIDQLHGQISMGFLIVQDIVVIFAMIIIVGFGDPAMEANLAIEIGWVLLKGLLFIGAIAMLMKLMIPKVVKKLAHTPELLILFSISWAVFLAAIGNWLGFSKEVGAFIGGISLASTRYREVISGRLVSIRDFLLLFFFIHIGAHFEFREMEGQITNSIIFSLFVLIGNPLIVMVIMGILGYRKRTGFLAGLTVAQISEFSLILASLGLELGHVDSQTVGLITLVGLITIGVSTYMILYSQKLFEWLGPYLDFFEKSNKLKEKAPKEKGKNYDYIIIGLGRFGKNLAELLSAHNFKIMVVDLSPKILSVWEKKGVDTQYGDAEDPELFQTLPLPYTKNIISTFSSFDSNIKLIKFLKENQFKGQIYFSAFYHSHAVSYKKEGVHEVFMPFLEATRVIVKKLTGK